MDLQLDGAVYIVTGGSSGLGLATAQQLVAEGARVVLGARSAPALEAAVEALGSDRAVGVEADLAEADSASRLVAAAHEAFGRLDGAMISAGGPPVGAAMDLEDDDWRTAVEMVLIGGIRVARVVARDLRSRGAAGSIAFVTSASVRSPHPGLATSNGLRPGVAMVAKTLADELGGDGIRVNAVIPGRITTPRLLEYDTFLGEEARAEKLAEIPLGRYGTPEEFGKVAAFLLSPAASYVTGSAVTVDGGATRAL